VKYMLDKLIIVNVYTTAKSNLCIMYHSIKGIGRPKSQNILVTLYRRSKPKKLFIHLT